MLVVTSNGQATICSPDGVLHTVPYEPLSDADMLLQARYHLWARTNEYRRELVCRRCKEKLETDTAVDEKEKAWQFLTVCSCRALYGTIPLSTVASAIAS